MLTLRRKEQETIIVTASNGERIEILIGQIGSLNVVVHVTAPQGVKILRGELESVK